MLCKDSALLNDVEDVGPLFDVAPQTATSLVMSVSSLIKVVVGCETTTTNSHNIINGTTAGAWERPTRDGQIPLIFISSLRRQSQEGFQASLGIQRIRRFRRHAMPHPDERSTTCSAAKYISQN
ncbi:uncharacterized protein [Dermacentor albipictus]|uniref:uncharacterized protein isoform X4 n=1 Tax=Dermacentor albipictus TaxID=60249 RepID=UPI0038FCC58F